MTPGDQSVASVEAYLQSVPRLRALTWSDPCYRDIIRSCVEGAPDSFATHSARAPNSCARKRSKIDIAFIGALMNVPFAEQIFNPRGIIIHNCHFPRGAACEDKHLPCCPCCGHDIISSRFDLADSRFALPLKLLDCEFDETLDLRRSHLASLDLSGSTLPALMLQGARVEGSLIMENTYLSFGKQRGQQFGNAADHRDPDAPRAGLDANDLVTGDRLSLKGAFVRGGIRMRRAQIAGDFVAKQATVINRRYTQAICLPSPATCRLCLREIRTHLTRNNLDSATDLRGLKTALNSGCRATLREPVVYNPDERAFEALHLYQAHIKGAVEFIDDFVAIGEVSLNSAVVDGGLFCRGGMFFQHDGVALSMDGAKVGGSVYLDRYVGRGPADKPFRSHSEGGLATESLDDGTFLCHGTVSMRGATIEHRLVITNASFFTRPKPAGLSDPLRERECYAFFAKRLRVGGDVFFNKNPNSRSGIDDNNLSVGPICLENAHIGGRLFLAAYAAPSVAGSALPLLNLDFAQVAATAHLQIGSPKLDSAGRRDSLIYLRSAQLGGFDISDCAHSNLRWDLDGLRYDLIEKVDEVQAGSHAWIDVWTKRILRRHQPEGELPPSTGAPAEHARLRYTEALQPFDALMGFLREIGRDSAANRVGIAKEDQITLNMLQERNYLLFIWRKVIGVLVRYGYKPEIGVSWLGGLILVGTVVFSLASGHLLGRVVDNDFHKVFPTRMMYFSNPNDVAGVPALKTGEYPRFQPFIYSLELATPLPPLGQEDHWDVEGVRLLEMYKWFHTIFGWVLSLLIIISPTKLLRRD